MARTQTVNFSAPTANPTIDPAAIAQKSFRNDPRQLLAQQLIKSAGSGPVGEGGGALSGIARVAKILSGVYSQHQLNKDIRDKENTIQDALSRGIEAGDIIGGVNENTPRVPQAIAGGGDANVETFTGANAVADSSEYEMVENRDPDITGLAALGARLSKDKDADVRALGSKFTFQAMMNRGSQKASAASARIEYDAKVALQAQKDVANMLRVGVRVRADATKGDLDRANRTGIANLNAQVSGLTAAQANEVKARLEIFKQDQKNNRTIYRTTQELSKALAVQGLVITANGTVSGIAGYARAAAEKAKAIRAAERSVTPIVVRAGGTAILPPNLEGPVTPGGLPPQPNVPFTPQPNVPFSTNGALGALTGANPNNTALGAALNPGGEALNPGIEPAMPSGALAGQPPPPRGAPTPPAPPPPEAPDNTGFSPAVRQSAAAQFPNLTASHDRRKARVLFESPHAAPGSPQKLRDRRIAATLNKGHKLAMQSIDFKDRLRVFEKIATGTFSGKGGDLRLEANKLIQSARAWSGNSPKVDAFLSKMGIGLAGLDKDIASAEAIRAMGNVFALMMRNPEGMFGGLTGHTSDRDLSFLKNSIPGLSTSPEGIKLLVSMFNRVNDRNFELAKYGETLAISGPRGDAPRDFHLKMLDRANELAGKEFHIFNDEDRKQVQKVSVLSGGGGNVKPEDMSDDQLKKGLGI